jgi:GMP synthase (glutamine-hydrolysing)
MDVLVIENMPHSNVGLVGVALGEAGARVEIVRPYLAEMLPQTADAHDALVVLGGDQSALDDALHPYLPNLARLMRLFCEADRSVLGICLGSQVLARAYGSDNHLGQATEFGWQPVALTEAGRADAVLSAAGDTFPAFEWHSDTFTLPQGAQWLAQTTAVPLQAFRIGRAGYGMQFHFEAGTEVVANWKRIYQDQIDRIDPEWLAHAQDLKTRHGADSDAAGLALARAWVRTILARSDQTIVSDAA